MRYWYWYHGIPNAQTIITIGNHNTCRRATDNRSADRMAGYSNQVSGAITCDCVYPGTHGTGSFCANDTCLHTLEALNAFAHASLGGGQFSSPYMTPQQTVHAGGVRSGEYAELQKEPNPTMPPPCAFGVLGGRSSNRPTCAWLTPRTHR